MFDLFVKLGGHKNLHITASKRNFLRVNAQMRNLDKQKTYACLQNVSGKLKRRHTE